MSSILTRIAFLTALLSLLAVSTRAVTDTTYNVRDYGAVGDGMADDTTACRTALAAAVAAGGGTVYFPAGTYRLAPTEEAGAIFTIATGNLAFIGEGPDLSILSCYAWGMRDPASLMLKRGRAFGVRPPIGGTLSGLVFRGLRVTGNAPPTANAGNWWGEGALDGWDIHHKGLGINGAVEDVLVEDCEWDHWRGEILYAGGGQELGAFTIRRTKVHDCNASAISMTGTVVIEDCEIYNAYNGTENYAFPGDTNHVIRTVIDLNRSVATPIGKFAITYLGDPQATLLVEDCSVRNSSFGVFLSESATRATIRRNTFIDTCGVYAIHLGQYATLPHLYADILIEQNTFRAETRAIDAAILFNTDYVRGFALRTNTVQTSGTGRFNSFFRGIGGTGEWLLADNQLGDTEPFGIVDKRFKRPAWSDNVVTGTRALGSRKSDYGTNTALAIPLEPSWPRYLVSDLANGIESRPATIAPDLLPAFFDGFTFELRRKGDRDGNEGVEIQPDPTWNTLNTRGYLIFTDAVLTLRFNAAVGRFDFLSYTPRSGTPYTLTQNYPSATSGNYVRNLQSLSFSGFEIVYLRPTVPHVFNKFSGVPENVPVQIDHNALATIAHVPGLLEIDTGADFVPAAPGVVTAIKNNGVLRVLTRQPADGGFPAWLARSGLPGDASAAGAPHADPDGDGAGNLLEYALARSALAAEPPAADPAALLPMPGTAPGDGSPAASPDAGYAVARDAVTGRLALTFRRARAELSYVVEACSDLAAPAGSANGWQPLATNPGAVGQVVTVSDALPANPGDAPPPRRFLRLRVESP